MEEKELAIIKKEVSSVVKLAQSFQVESPEQEKESVDLLAKIKATGKMLTARKEEITRPLMTSLSKVRDLFKPREQELLDAEKIIKGKVLAYRIEQEEKAEKEKARIEARVAKGTMKAETAVDKLANIPDTEKTVVGNTGSKLSTVKVQKVRIVDEFAIPREYLVPDIQKITQAILKEGATIPGVEKYEEKRLASRG